MEFELFSKNFNRILLEPRNGEESVGDFPEVSLSNKYYQIGRYYDIGRAKRIKTELKEKLSETVAEFEIQSSVSEQDTNKLQNVYYIECVLRAIRKIFLEIEAKRKEFFCCVGRGDGGMEIENDTIIGESMGPEGLWNAIVWGAFDSSGCKDVLLKYIYILMRFEVNQTSLESGYGDSSSSIINTYRVFKLVKLTKQLKEEIFGIFKQILKETTKINVERRKYSENLLKRLKKAAETIGNWVWVKCRELDLMDMYVERWNGFRHGIVVETYLNVRLEDIISIIKNYPTSMGIINELKECSLGEVAGRVIRELVERIDQQLLAPDMCTEELVGFLVKLVYTSRGIGHSDSELEKVTFNLRQYLKKRNDINTVLISMMFGGEIPSFGRDNIWVSGGTDITSLVMHWKKSTTATQESIGGGYQNSIRSRAVERKIVTLLVELISNKRVFIAEFERKLSEKLIKANSSIELRELEQVVYKLQKEIGSKELVANCLVMLNDIKLSFEFCEECNLDSNRDSGGSRVVVISENHWPIKSANKSGGANVQFNTPGFVADSASFYKEMYSKVNDTHRNSAGSSSRRLVFCGPNHGFVELHIELKCGFSRTFECKPLAATVLLSINQQSSDDSNGFNGWVKHSDLIKCMDCHATEVNNAIEYWLDNNILLEYTNQINDFYYKPKESISDTVSQLPASQLPVSVPVAATLNIASHDNTHSINNNNNNNNTDYETTNNTGLDIGLSQYDNYIIGMLTNLGPLPLDRIADMLEMFIDTDISFKDSDSKALLQSHLEALVQNRTLKFDSHQRCYSLC